MVHMALTGDFSMPNRADLMSLSTISKKKDQVSTSTYDRFSTIRNTSNNLATGDIDGKSISKTLKGQLQLSVTHFRCGSHTAWFEEN